jgi:hypothetical protein
MGSDSLSAIFFVSDLVVQPLKLQMVQNKIKKTAGILPTDFLFDYLKIS